MENTKKQKKLGVTLIEIMMVIAIIGIMSSIVFVNVKRDGSIVQSAARELATDLRTLKRSALNGKLPAGVPRDYICNEGFRLNAVSASSSSYAFLVRAKNGVSGTCFYSLYLTKTLSNGVTFSSAVSPLNFTVPHGKLLNTGVTYTYTLSKGSCSMTVTVTADGDITEGSLSGC